MATKITQTQLKTTSKFERDMKRVRKRGKDMRKIESVMRKLADRETLPPGNQVHRLQGTWDAHWECHVEGDWLLIWRDDGDSIVLTRTGTHSDLFG